MNDNSTKSLMVDERQVARDVLDNLFEKTHCDCNINWCLYEIYPELQIGNFQTIRLYLLIFVWLSQRAVSGFSQPVSVLNDKCAVCWVLKL